MDRARLRAAWRRELAHAAWLFVLGAFALLLILTYLRNYSLWQAGFTRIAVEFAIVRGGRPAGLGPGAILPVILVLGWLGALALSPGIRRGLLRIPAAISTPLVGLWLLTWLSLDTTPGLTTAGRIQMSLWTSLALFLFAASMPGATKVFTWTWLAITALQAVVGIAQVVRHDALGLFNLGEVRPSTAQAGAYVLLSQGLLFLRAFGLTPHSNIFGSYLALALPFAAGLYVTGGRWQRRLALALGALILSGVLLSFSRAAWVAGALGMAAMALILWQGRAGHRIDWSRLARPAALGLVVIIAFALVFAEPLAARLSPSSSFREGFSLEERALMLRVAFDLLRQDGALLSGAGAGHFIEAARALGTPDAQRVIRPVHNVALLAATESGVLAGLFWLWLAALPAVLLIVRRRHLAAQPLLVAVVAAWLALSMIGLSDPSQWPAVQWQGGFLMATLAGLATRLLTYR
jgi:hypothetical protein